MDPMREMRVYSILEVDPSFIIMIKNKYLTDNMWKIAIEKEPSLFQYMKDPSEEMVLFALSEDGANIQYLEKLGIAITPKMMYTAVHSYPGAIFLIPKELRTAKLREFACKEDPELMRDLPLQPSFVRGQLRKDPTLVRFLNDPDEDQICRAIEADPNVCVYIRKFTPKIRDLIRKLYPEIIPLIPRLSEEFSEHTTD